MYDVLGDGAACFLLSAIVFPFIVTVADTSFEKRNAKGLVANIPEKELEITLRCTKLLFKYTLAHDAASF